MNDATPPRAVIFDDNKHALAPMTDLRAAFDIRTGALTNLERLRAVLAQVMQVEVAALICPDELAELTRERTDLPVNPASLTKIPATLKLELAGAGAAKSPLDLAPPLTPKAPTQSNARTRDSALLLINGRCVLPPMDLSTLPLNHAIVEERETEVHVVAAHLSTEDADDFIKNSFTLPDTVSPQGLPESIMIDLPWDVIGYRNQAIEADLAILCAQPGIDTPQGVTTIGNHAIRIAPNATVYPGVILDASQGPISIDDNATIRPGAILIGPCSIGIKSHALERATVKPNTAIGPVSKVNGEVSGIIIQGFTNKAHDGFIGDAWLGEWVNLGAGTTGSNLLNTYAEVTAQTHPTTRRTRTNLTFFGGCIGDHVKTAIETTLMTGSIIGTGSMIATSAYAPTTLPRFRWLTDNGQRHYRIDKFLDVARAAMARRSLEPTAAYTSRLRNLAQREQELLNNSESNRPEGSEG